MKTFKCKNCGSTDFIHKGGVYTCKYCGSIFHEGKSGTPITHPDENRSYVTIHAIPIVITKKAFVIEAYKDGEIVEPYDGRNDVKVPVTTDSVFCLRIKGKGSTLTANMKKDVDTHLFPWIDTFNKPKGIKSGNTDSVQALQKQGKFQSRAFAKRWLYLLLSYPLCCIPFIWGFAQTKHTTI